MNLVFYVYIKFHFSLLIFEKYTLSPFSLIPLISLMENANILNLKDGFLFKWG